MINKSKPIPYPFSSKLLELIQISYAHQSEYFTLIKWSYMSPPPNPIMLTIKPITVDTFWAWHPISYKNTYLLNVRSHKHIKPHITRLCVLIIVVLDIGMSTLSPCTLGVFKPICFWICRPRTRRHHVDSLLDQFIHEFTCSRSCNNDLSCLSSPHTQGTQWGPIKSTDRISDYFVCFLSS